VCVKGRRFGLRGWSWRLSSREARREDASALGRVFTFSLVVGKRLQVDRGELEVGVKRDHTPPTRRCGSGCALRPSRGACACPTRTRPLRADVPLRVLVSTQATIHGAGLSGFPPLEGGTEGGLPGLPHKAKSQNPPLSPLLKGGRKTEPTFARGMVSTQVPGVHRGLCRYQCPEGAVVFRTCSI
jgi:hypothetical protein